MTDWAALERGHLTRDLRKLARLHADLTAQHGPDKHWAQAESRDAGHFQSGICSALQTLHANEGTTLDRRNPGAQMQELLDCAIGRGTPHWKGGHLRFQPEYPDYTLGAWSERAWLCLFLAEFIDSGDFVQ